MNLKHYPKYEQPREKAIHYGIERLSNVELLALLLRTGNKQESVLELSRRVLEEIGGFQELKVVGYHQLVSIKGIKEAKAITVLAILEISKRLLEQPVNKMMIKEPKDAYLYIKNRVHFEKQEKVYVLCLNTHLEVVKEKLLFVGSVDMSVISGREIFKEAFLCGSNRIVVIHNHPSGHPQPSTEDREITDKLTDMARKLEIELVDHIIVGNNCFYSFASNMVVKI